MDTYGGRNTFGKESIMTKGKLDESSTTNNTTGTKSFETNAALPSHLHIITRRHIRDKTIGTFVRHSRIIDFEGIQSRSLDRSTLLE